MSNTGVESVAPYILYSAATTNGIKISIMLEELGGTYETRVVDFAKGEQKDPAYLRLNPNGKIPTLVDRSEDDFVIFESGAILLYLARIAVKAGEIPKNLKINEVADFIVMGLQGALLVSRVERDLALAENFEKTLFSTVLA